MPVEYVAHCQLTFEKIRSYDGHICGGCLNKVRSPIEINMNFRQLGYTCSILRCEKCFDEMRGKIEQQVQGS